MNGETDDGARRDENAEQTAAPPRGPNYMLLFLIMMLSIMIFPELRTALGLAMHAVLFPLIGFDYMYPLLTIMLAGLFMTLVNVVVRHFLTDWLAMAEMQHKFRYLGTLLREARLSGDEKKMERVIKMQRELAPEQMEHQNRMMRPMVATFLIVIAVFTWLWMFISNAPDPTVRLPWGAVVDMRDMFLIFPMWVVIYSLVSIPVMVLVQSGLKWMYFRRLLEED